MSMSPAAYQLLLVYTTYVIAAGSPGPSTMRIMGVAMNQGRKAGLIFASGVVTGSIFWGLMAVTGVSAILTRFAEALVILKIFGGLYLLYLAFKAGRAAMTSDAKIAARADQWRCISLRRRALSAWIADASLQPQIHIVVDCFGHTRPWYQLVLASSGCVSGWLYCTQRHYFLRLCDCVLNCTDGALVSRCPSLD